MIGGFILRRVWQALGVFLLLSGAVRASGIVGCSLDATSLNLNQCYSPSTFFTAPLTLDWGVAFGSADPSSVAPGPWITNIAGVNVGVTIGGDYSSPSNAAPKLARVNNETYVWNTSLNTWVIPQFSGDPTLMTYDGHFNAPGPNPQAGDGDHLLETYLGSGSNVITFDRAGQGIYSVGFLLSTQALGFNADFDATIKAYDRNSNLLGTYIINTQGVGAECQSISTNSPVPCNDAPFIGIRAPSNLTSQQIYSIVISATTNGSLDSLLLDSLRFQAGPNVPEPAAILLCGAGLVAVGVLRARRSSRKG